MAQGDLATLANVKAWAGVNSTTQDVLLGRLISAVSATIARYINRSNIGSTLITERYDGTGGNTLALRSGPVTDIISILYDGNSVTQYATGNPPSGGFLLDNSSTLGLAILADDTFSTGRMSAQVTYRAGYLVSSEAHTGATSVTTNQTWFSDVGVKYASGASLTSVTGTPTTGQYRCVLGTYTFAAGDVGASLLISYGTVPADLEQICIELVGERYKSMDRIGLTTKTLAGQEVISFGQGDMNKYTKMALTPFRRVTPV